MDLSILIPARNEMFLSKTIQDILQNSTSETEIITVLDGEWADPPVEQHPRVSIIFHNQSIGQRAATNEAAKIASGKYVMKVDAHCAFDNGFDTKLLADMNDNWTVVPIMRNLHVFDWVCSNGHRRYQGPSGPCKECGEPTEMDIVWRAKPSPQSKSYCFDATPHFQYFNEFSKRPEGKGDITETMSLQGSCFMMTRDRYFDLNVCDEEFGSWGSQGIEVAVKSWLSGGRVIVNHKTWYAHMFRTQGPGFGFPYHQSGKQVKRAKERAKKIFFSNGWEKQTRPISWLVKKFWPVPGWTEDDLNNLETDKLSKGIIYYTDNRIDSKIMNLCQEWIQKSRLPIVSASLKPIDFGKNIVFDGKRGYLTMFKQILAALEEIDTDIVFFCEHDVLYSPSHFDFYPNEKNIFYYNTNVWKVRSDGHALYCDDLQQTSGLCAYRELLLEHYRKRVERVEKEGKFDRHIGFEPGTHSYPRGIDNYHAKNWRSEYPNVDIRHNNNLTPSRWRKDQFRNQRYTRGWKESNTVNGWENIIDKLIRDK